jgi:GDP-4-dehydro-6-deoxy-D-mannose reductase
MKALITGAGGFAGSHLAEYLLGQGMEVMALVREDESLVHLQPILSQVRVERCDILDANRLSWVFANQEPHRVYHLAALTSPAGSLQNPTMTYQTNVMGTLHLLEGVRRAGRDRRFLFVSSSEVYGEVSDEQLPLREDSALHPANPYAGSKAAGEIMTCQFVRSYGIEAVCVRPFNHTGPRQSSAFVCSSLARQVAEIVLGMRENVIKVGDLESSRDFTDVRDIVRGYHLLLEKGEPGDVYQLSSGRPVSVASILGILRDSTSIPIRVEVDPARVHAHSARALWGVAEKAERAVGWKPRYSLETTLLDLKAYWEDALRSSLSVRS